MVQNKFLMPDEHLCLGHRAAWLLFQHFQSQCDDATNLALYPAKPQEQFF